MINIKNTANFLGIGDSLNALGISIDDPCDASALVGVIVEETTALVKEAEESINLISAKAGAGNFLTTVVSILGDFASAAIGELVDTFVADMLFGNLLGSMASLLTLMLTAIKGIELIILYYATLNLKRQLEYRITIGQILEQELSFLINFIDAVNDIFDDSGKSASYAEMSAALRYVKDAELKVGMERARYDNEGAISVNNINGAMDSIDLARNALSGGVLNNIKEQIQEIHNEFGMMDTDKYAFTEAGLVPGGGGNENFMDQFSSGVFPDLSVFEEYFKDLKQNIKEKFVSQLEPTDPNYEADVQAKKQDLAQFIFKLVPILPKILQASMMTSVVEHSTNTLLEKMPIITLINEKNRKKLNKLLKPGNLGFGDLVPEETETPKPLFFTDPKTKDLTYKHCMTAVGIAEAAILMFPTYWNYIQQTGMLGAAFLTPAANSLRGIRMDMESWVEGTASGSDKVWKAQGKKITWASRLAATRGMLKTMTGTDYFSQQLGVNPQEAAEEAEAALEALDELRTAIDARHTNFDGSFRETPGEKAFEIGQKYLMMLSAGAWFTVFKKAHVVGGIQGCRMAIRAQIAEDRDLVVYCQNFIQLTESMSTFPALKAAMDNLMASLQGTAAAGLLEDLANGDMANLVNQLENVAMYGEMANALFCMGNTAAQGGLFGQGPLAAGYAAFMGVDLSDKTQVNKFKSWLSSKNQIVDDLKDKKDVLSGTMASVENILEFAGSLDVT